MEIQIWEMIVTNERTIMERRLERRARAGRPAAATPLRNVLRLSRFWQNQALTAPRIQPQEAS
jgi:hypothetical protein